MSFLCCTDPARFSNIYRMFEAKSAPPKFEKGVTTNAETIRPTNRLWPKKTSIATMTDSGAYDGYDVNGDDILQADDACGSSTFDQQTEIDEGWLEQGDVSMLANRKKLNAVTASTSNANGGIERIDLEGDDVSEDGATIQWDTAAGGKVTSKTPVQGVIIPSHEEQLMAGKNRNSPELIMLPPKQLSHCKSNAMSHDMKICEGDDQEVDNFALLSPSDYASKTSWGKSGPGLPNSSKAGFQTEASRGISVSEYSVGRPPNNRGPVLHPDYADVELSNPQGTSLTNHEQEFNNAHAKSLNQQTMKIQLEEDNEEYESCRPGMSGSHTGKASGSSSSKASYELDETYENVVPSKCHRVTSEVKGYQNDLTESGNRSTTEHTVEKSTGKSGTSDGKKQRDEYNNVILPGTQQHQQQKVHSASGRHPSEPVPPDSNKESGTRKQLSSLSSTENAQLLGRDSATCPMLQSTAGGLHFL